jgi:hypothetical protein
MDFNMIPHITYEVDGSVGCMVMAAGPSARYLVCSFPPAPPFLPEVEQSQRIVQAAPRMAALLLRIWERELGTRTIPDLSYLLADLKIIPRVHFLGAEEVYDKDCAVE